MKKTWFMLVTDLDENWYVIPESARTEWEGWLFRDMARGLEVTAEEVATLGLTSLSGAGLPDKLPDWAVPVGENHEDVRFYNFEVAE